MPVRLQALRGLGEMKAKSAGRKITALLKDPSGGIRVNTLSTLITLNERAALPAVRKALGDEEWYVRQNACVACGHFKDRTAKKKLLQLEVSDSKKAVREAARAALQQIGIA